MNIIKNPMRNKLMKNKISAAFMSGILAFSTFSVNFADAASTQPSGTMSASTQATANLAAVCTISAQNLAFGALVLPLSAQTASTSMTVLCSNKASYTVDLAYGGVYGAGTQTVPVTWTNGPSCKVGNQIGNVFYENYAGTIIGSACFVSGGPTTTTATIGATYAYGMMTGVASGDHIAYSIQVPNNPGQVWNTNNYSYSATGTGLSQTLPVVGSLVPGQSSSPYPTPDSYLDTVTATVSF